MLMTRWRLHCPAVVVALLLLAAAPARAVPLEVTESRSLRTGELLVIVLPLDSALKEWRLVSGDPALLEVREQAKTPYTFTLTVAGLAPGEARLVLQQAFLVPPETVLERRIVRLRVTGLPLPAAAASRAAAAEPGADTRLTTLFNLLQSRHGDSAAAMPPAGGSTAAAAPVPEANTAPPLSTAVPVARPAAAPVRVRRPPPTVWVTVPGEQVDGQPRRERLTTVLEWLTIADELFREDFPARAQTEFERALPFVLPDEVAARVRCGLAECRYRAGDRPGAIERFREVVTSYAGTSLRNHARLRLGQLLMESDDYQEAVKEFMYLREQAGGTLTGREGQFNLAQCYARLLRYEDALAEFERAAREDGRAEWRARSWFEIAKIYDFVPALRDYYRALDYYRRVNGGEHQTDAMARARFIEQEYL